MLSLFGLLAGLVLLIVLTMRGVNLFILAPLVRFICGFIQWHPDFGWPITRPILSRVICQVLPVSSPAGF